MPENGDVIWSSQLCYISSSANINFVGSFVLTHKIYELVYAIHVWMMGYMSVRTITPDSSIFTVVCWTVTCTTVVLRTLQEGGLSSTAQEISLDDSGTSTSDWE